MIYFTSDTHFYHKAIIGYCNRPIPALSSVEDVTTDVERMNQLLVSNWNSRITNEDEVYFLGDFAFASNTKILGIVKQLKGKKYWIRGNHDYGANEAVLAHFQWWKDYYNLKVQDQYESDDGETTNYHQPIVLCHFPILSWDGMAHGSWHLHGHCHGSLPPTRMARLDVGVDTNNLVPYSYEDIKKIMVMRSVVPVDYHGTQDEQGKVRG